MVRVVAMLFESLGDSSQTFSKDFFIIHMQTENMSVKILIDQKK